MSKTNLLQKYWQLMSHLLLQLGVSSKKRVVHQHLGRTGHISEGNNRDNVHQQLQEQNKDQGISRWCFLFCLFGVVVVVVKTPKCDDVRPARRRQGSVPETASCCACREQRACSASAEDSQRSAASGSAYPGCWTCLAKKNLILLMGLFSHIYWKRNSVEVVEMVTGAQIGRIDAHGVGDTGGGGACGRAARGSSPRRAGLRRSPWVWQWLSVLRPGGLGPRVLRVPT